MDPVNGDAELSEERSEHQDEEEVARSASYWEEVDQEEVERERRYSEFIRFYYYSFTTRTSRPYWGISGKICKSMPVMFTYYMLTVLQV